MNSLGSPTWRTNAAMGVGSLVAGASRRLGRGQGRVVGARVTLALAPRSLEELAAGREIVLISGTNGKTTTTRLAATALGTASPVSTNDSGANLLTGLCSALAGTPRRRVAVLEVDEGLLAEAVKRLAPRVVVMSNLSRDQLDRIGEVRNHAAAWGRALGASPGTVAVANADDPLVAWAGSHARRIVWVQTGQAWSDDAAACARCGAPIIWGVPAPPCAPLPDGTSGSALDAGAETSESDPSADATRPPARNLRLWRCSGCDASRPEPAVLLEADGTGLDRIRIQDDRCVDLDLALPGWCNRANAALAVAAALALDPHLDLDQVSRALGGVGEIEGRYQQRQVGAVRARLLLAKNPAGWAETLDLIRPAPVGLAIGINARVADGRDPSWLWDVAFERLAGRRVVATGDRRADLAVRLRYAGVAHQVAATWPQAVELAAGGQSEVDVAANYTSFQEARAQL
ncbi:MAG: MurT ligase domain-containing protein [Acidimicrobiales bacterium]